MPATVAPYRVVLLHTKATPADVVRQQVRRTHDLLSSGLGVPYADLRVTAARTAWEHFQQTVAEGPRDYEGFVPYLCAAAPHRGYPRFNNAVIFGATRVGRNTANIVRAFLHDGDRAVVLVEDGAAPRVRRVVRTREIDAHDWRGGWAVETG